MSEDIKTLVVKERWRRWNESSNIHILDEAPQGDRTKVIRQKPNIASDDTYIPQKSDSGRRPVGPEDERPPPESSADTDTDKYVKRNAKGDATSLTDLGKVALKVNNIWTSHLAQLVTFQAGKQLASQIGQRLAQQTGLDPVAAEKISAAVMKQVLEHLDDVVSADVEKSLSGVLDVSRG